MTIRVEVTNKDSREKAVIIVDTLGEDGMPNRFPGKQLKGGESDEFLIHSTQQLLVSEVSNG